jgi:hypothetical protein
MDLVAPMLSPATTVLVHLQRRTKPRDGFIDLDENTPGLGLTVDEEGLKRFEVIE